MKLTHVVILAPLGIFSPALLAACEVTGAPQASVVYANDSQYQGQYAPLATISFNTMLTCANEGELDELLAARLDAANPPYAVEVSSEHGPLRSNDGVVNQLLFSWQSAVGGRERTLSNQPLNQAETAIHELTLGAGKRESVYIKDTFLLYHATAQEAVGDIDTLQPLRVNIANPAGDTVGSYQLTFPSLVLAAPSCHFSEQEMRVDLGNVEISAIPDHRNSPGEGTPFTVALECQANASASVSVKSSAGIHDGVLLPLAHSTTENVAARVTFVDGQGRPQPLMEGVSLDLVGDQHRSSQQLLSFSTQLVKLSDHVKPGRFETAFTLEVAHK
ncbi:fimbrial protein [Aeromonas hydrophila]|uniref:fimbrial protein n=1 Tax=Aeromonas hydrophila TaxID=644 RepID=UPI001F536322|nr:fimbrial protein [Aeromonas hydrophila]UUT59984.1 fimbrial protein [Aeromonas hydrophila]